MERRKNKRASLNSKLEVKSLFQSGNQQDIKSNFAIDITDISKSGMGFIANEILPLEHYFNTKVIIDENREFFCVLKIVRVEEMESGFHYGSEFVGLAEILSYQIDDYVEEIE
jgi:c-di-GMP-binding flagellar brake protein YcgR